MLPINLTRKSDELIYTAKKSLISNSRVEKDVTAELCGLLQSAAKDPEGDVILKKILSLVLRIYETEKDRDYEQDDEFCIILSHCIECLHEILKRNGNEHDALCKEAVDTLLAISHRNSQIPNVLLQCISNSLLNIIISSKIELKSKKEFLKILNFILENSERSQRYRVRNDINLMKLSELLYTSGDYDFQVNIIETFFRYISLEQRSLYGKVWLHDHNEIISVFSAISDFEPDCRKFLNLFNKSLKDNQRVFSLPCVKAITGNCELRKPEHPDYEEFWVDFNLGSNSISVVCSQDSLYSSSVLSTDIGPGFWETIVIETQIVEKVTLQQISWSMDSNRYKEEFWEMCLILFKPCYAVFSSFTCNFEGNICTFIFPKSVLFILHSILKKLFLEKYYYDSNIVSKRNVRQKASISDINMEDSKKVARTNAEKELNHKNIIVKENTKQTEMQGQKTDLLSSGSSEKNTVERGITNNIHRIRKDKISGNQEQGRLTSLSSVSKSPFKPLEIIISPGHGKRITPTSEKIPNTKNKNSSEKISTVVQQKKPEDTSSSKTYNNSTGDKYDALHPQSTRTFEAKVLGNSSKKICEVEEENYVSMNRPIKGNNDKTNEKVQKSMKNVLKEQDIDVSEVEKNSINAQSQPENQGRILRSHKRNHILNTQSNNDKSMLPDKKDGIVEATERKLQIEGNSTGGEKYISCDKLNLESKGRLTKQKRGQSLGELHLRQLLNRDLAIERATNKTMDEKHCGNKKSMEQLQSTSEKIPLRKKLFNNRDQSVLGPATNDKSYPEVKNKSGDENMVRPNKSAVKNDLKRKSVFSDWFSETSTEYSWLKPDYKEKTLNLKSYTTKKNVTITKKSSLPNKRTKVYTEEDTHDDELEYQNTEEGKIDLKQKGTISNVILNPKSDANHEAEIPLNRNAEGCNKEKQTPRNVNNNVNEIQEKKEDIIANPKAHNSTEKEKNERKLLCKDSEKQVIGTTSKHFIKMPDQETNLQNESQEKIQSDVDKSDERETAINKKKDLQKSMKTCTSNENKGNERKLSLVTPTDTQTNSFPILKKLSLEAKSNTKINSDQTKCHQSKTYIKDNINNKGRTADKHQSQKPLENRGSQEHNQISSSKLHEIYKGEDKLQSLQSQEDSPLKSTENSSFICPTQEKEVYLNESREEVTRNKKKCNERFMKKSANKFHDASVTDKNKTLPNSHDFSERIQNMTTSTDINGREKTFTKHSRKDTSLIAEKKSVSPSISDNSITSSKLSICSSDTKNVCTVRGSSYRLQKPEKDDSDSKKEKSKPYNSFSLLSQKGNQSNIQEIDVLSDTENDKQEPKHNRYDITTLTKRKKTDEQFNQILTPTEKKNLILETSDEENSISQTYEKLMNDFKSFTSGKCQHKSSNVSRESQASFVKDGTSESSTNRITSKKNDRKKLQQETTILKDINSSDQQRKRKRSRSKDKANITINFDRTASPHENKSTHSCKRKKLSTDELPEQNYTEEITPLQKPYLLKRPPNVKNILENYMLKKYENFEETGNKIFLCIEETIGTMQDDNMILINRITKDYLRQMSNEIEKIDANARHCEEVQGRLQKCFKYLSYTYNLKSAKEKQSRKSLNRIHNIKEEIIREKTEATERNSKIRYQALVTENVNLICKSYLAKEYKNETLKAMTRLRSILHC